MSSNVRSKIAVLSLGALSFVVIAILPAWSEPSIELSPLPRALSSGLDAAGSLRSADGRAAEIGAEVGEAARRARAYAAASMPIAGLARRSTSGAGASTSVRKAASTAAPGRSSTARTPGSPIGLAPAAFTARMGPGGTVRSLQAFPAEALQHALGDSTADNERTVRSFLQRQRPLLGLTDPDRELRLRSRYADRLGHRHLRFEQTFEGVPVFGAELVAQLDVAGNLITLNGSYAQTPRKLVTQPVVQRAHAADLVSALYPESSNDSRSAANLVVFLKDGATPHLAWNFEVRIGLLEMRLVMVDAHTGAVLADFNQIQSSNQPGSGVDLFGSHKNLSVWEENGIHYMVDTSKQMYDPASSPPQLTSSNGVIMIQDAANQPPTNDPKTIPTLGSVTSSSPNGPWLPTAVSAASNLSATYDYFLHEHGRNSLDDNGGNLLAVVRLGQGYANAAFDSSTQTMYFGDAAPYAGALDVVAHELTHGVIANSANLLYQGQSGALNEAFADIFAEMVEAQVNGQPDWLLGSMLGSPLRNMANPGAVQFAPGMPYPSRMSEYVAMSADNGGVHYNSSIVNHAFYLLSVGLPDAVGIHAAADIFYRALTTKLTRLSDFTDARFAAIQSAEELFGVDSPQSRKTSEAFDAVQIFDTPTNPLPPPFTGTDGADSTLFVYWDSADGAYYLGRFESSLGDPSSGIQLTLNGVTPVKPSVAGDGTFAVFVDEQNDVCFISTDALSVESCIGFPGATSSIAMSPDASTFAFVLLDATGDPDNAINVVDIESGETRTFDLVSPLYDGTTSIQVLRADALDFTADSRFVVYDAFNALAFADASSLGVWSIYAIDLVTEATLALLPPTVDDQGNPLNIAFPSIAQTSDGHMTFDVLDSTAGQNYVFAGNLFTGALALVGTTSTYSTPGYVGDDTGIVYSVSDLATPTQFSLVRRQIQSDRISATGPGQLWLVDADYGVIYRRGLFSGPRSVDLAVSQSATTAPGHRAIFRIEVTNLGLNAATNVRIANTLTSSANVAVTQSDSGCTVLAFGSVSCDLPHLQPGATEVVEVAVEVQSVGSVTSSATAFANEVDNDSYDNTSFSTLDAALLNVSPTAVAPMSATSSRVGTAFSFGFAGNFADADNDTLSFKATGLPTGLGIDAVTGTISGTPFTGTDRTTPYTVQITASDTFGGSAVASLSLMVNSPPLPPSTGGGGSSSGGGGGSGAVDLWTLMLLLLCVGSVIASRRRQVGWSSQVEGITVD